MLPINALGGEMLQNELLVLKIIVGVGFIGWMMLMYVHTVFLADESAQEQGSEGTVSFDEHEEQHAAYELRKAA